MSKAPTSTRPSTDDYFLGFARQAATRATCLRKKVGAVIARDGILLSTGYNGSIRGMPHCTNEGVGCCRTVHAEINAVLQAAKNGVRIDGATLYVTASPCWPCFSAIANAGIRRIVFGEAYRATDPGPKRVIEVAKLVGIELVDFTTSQAELKAAHEKLAAVSARFDALVSAFQRGLLSDAQKAAEQKAAELKAAELKVPKAPNKPRQREQREQMESS